MLLADKRSVPGRRYGEIILVKYNGQDFGLEAPSMQILFHTDMELEFSYTDNRAHDKWTVFFITINVSMVLSFFVRILNCNRYGKKARITVMCNRYGRTAFKRTR